LYLEPAAALESAELGQAVLGYGFVPSTQKKRHLPTVLRVKKCDIGATVRFFLSIATRIA